MCVSAVIDACREIVRAHFYLAFHRSVVDFIMSKRAHTGALGICNACRTKHSADTAATSKKQGHWLKDRGYAQNVNMRLRHIEHRGKSPATCHLSSTQQCDKKPQRKWPRNIWFQRNAVTQLCSNLVRRCCSRAAIYIAMQASIAMPH